MSEYEREARPNELEDFNKEDYPLKKDVNKFNKPDIFEKPSEV